MTTFDRNKISLKALNSLTKYPSIPTYHELDPRTGSLLDNPTNFTGDVIGTEKVDGTNSRIILLPDGSYILGSRENLLYASGDLIGDPAQGIVENLHDDAEQTGLELTPRLFSIPAAALPTDIEATHAMLGVQLPRTLVALDASGQGRSEGIVLRTADRSVIAKARFQDYERTLKRRAGSR